MAKNLSTHFHPLRLPLLPDVIVLPCSKWFSQRCDPDGFALSLPILTSPDFHVNASKLYGRDKFDFRLIDVRTQLLLITDE